MKVSDLRMYNYYQMKPGNLGGLVARIASIKDFAVIYDFMQTDGVEGIELTDEWLLKFGFTYKNYSFYHSTHSHFYSTASTHVHHTHNFYK